MRRACVSLAVVMLVSPGCSRIEESRFRSHVRNKPAPDFELAALDGGKVRLSDFRGRRVLLAFWAYG